MHDATLHMIRAEVDRPGLARFARSIHLPVDRIDEGYLTHCARRAAFADDAPQPFALIGPQGRVGILLGYAKIDSGGLRARVAAGAAEAAVGAFRLERLASKPMPAEWQDGLRLAFEARVCPVVRKSKGGERSRAGAEVDSFLSRCWQEGPSVVVDREAVYREWLANELSRGGAARLVSARLLRFQRERLSRRTHREGRRWGFSERPDATLGGVLEVLNGSAFASLVARGLGRHRAFGFGMLLLKPPPEC